MNLIPLAFGFFEVGGQDNAAAGRVGFKRVRDGCGVGHGENRLEHLDDVVEGMFVVIENDDVIKLGEFVFCRIFNIGV